MQRVAPSPTTLRGERACTTKCRPRPGGAGVVPSAWAVVAAALVVAGCSSPPAAAATPSCVSGLDTSCNPLYAPPTYTTIFDNIFHPTCAQGMGTCHTSDAAKGGLVFEKADAAYALLLGMDAGRARVVPGNPSCSLIVEKLESSDPSFRMPPGLTPLPEPARCDIVQWIAQGAAP